MKKAILFLLPAIILASLIFAQNTGNKPAQSNKKKYSYAILYYLDKWEIAGNPIEIIVEGSLISSELSNKVRKTKNLDEALEFMGAEGWELESALIRKIMQGEEFIHYMRKELN